MGAWPIGIDAVRRLDLTGKRFGRLVAVWRFSRRGQTRWWCWCRCGTLRSFSMGNLRNGATKSCGCLRITHHLSRTPTHVVWIAMRKRVRGTACASGYFDRGIVCCKRWLKFENFLADMGERPASRTLGRIDNDGPYSPKNCRWETAKQQARNRRSSHLVTVDGKTATVAEWAESFGIPYNTLLCRINHGWSPKRAVTQPVRP